MKKIELKKDETLHLNLEFYLRLVHYEKIVFYEEELKKKLEDCIKKILDQYEEIQNDKQKQK